MVVQWRTLIGLLNISLASSFAQTTPTHRSNVDLKLSWTFEMRFEKQMTFAAAWLLSSEKMHGETINSGLKAYQWWVDTNQS